MRIAVMHYADVRNYGDVLFPRVLAYELKARLPEATFDFFAPTEDACPPLNSRRLDRADPSAYAAVLLAGGQVVHRGDEFLRQCYESYGLSPIRNPTDMVFRWLDWDVGFKAWIGVGIPPTTEEAARSIATAGRQLSHVSVRGTISAAQFASAADREPDQRIPDLGWLFPRLAEHEGWTLPAELLAQLGEAPYVAVQTLPWPAVREHSGQIIETLSRIEDQWGLRVVLLPITDYCRDHEMLAWLNREAGGRFVLLPPRLTYEQRGRILLGAEAFLGQSLHGVLTVLASGSPAGAVMPRSGDQKFVETLDDLGLGHLRCEAWSEFDGLAHRVLGQSPAAIAATAHAATTALSEYLDELAEQLKLHRHLPLRPPLPLSQTSRDMTEPTELPWTGERLVPSLSGDIVLEHLHRYALATELAAGRDVLDIACGEGYGSHLLALRARSVVGVDLDADTIAHAQHKYTRPNLRFTTGSCTAIPLADGSVDLVASFETLEHFVEQEAFLVEARRVLRPGGVLILSTPDRRIYTGRLGNRNQFHPRELDAEEFAALLGKHFAHTTLWNQRVSLGSFVAPMQAGDRVQSGTHRGDWTGLEFTPGVAEGVYLLAVCSDAPVPELHAGLFEFGTETAGAFIPPLSVEREATTQAAAALRGELEQAAAALTDTHARLKEACQHWEYAQARLRQQEGQLQQSAAALTDTHAKLKEACQHWEYAQARLRQQEAELQQSTAALQQAFDEAQALRSSYADQAVRLRATDGEATDLRVKLERSTAALADVQGKLQEACQHWEFAHACLQEQERSLESFRSELAAAQGAQETTARQLHQTSDRLQQTQAELTAMQQSPSWKATKPLRSLGKRAAEIRELVRRGAARLHLTRNTRRLHRAAKLIRRSGLFDVQWYGQYPAARPGRPDPVLHYLVRGYREGCEPNPLFDSRWYLQQNSDVAAAGLNPLAHYLEHGAAEGRDPNPFFDSDWYLAQNPEVRAAGDNPLAHYLVHGAAAGRRPNPQFDGKFYLEQHPDVRAAGMNPLAHYLLHGRTEGRCIRADDDGPPVPAAVATPAPSGRRILFLSGEPRTPGHDYRVQMYSRALASRGYHVAVTGADQPPNFTALDCLIIWRTPWSKRLARTVAAARNCGAKVVFDVDDLMFDPELARCSVIDGIRSQGFEEAAIAELYRQIQQTMLAADYCTCTTQPLANALRRFQKTTYVLPNGFDETRYARSRQAVAARRQRGSDGLIRIGYAGGSRTHQKDFACAAPAVARILREHPECRLVLFRLELPSGKFPCLDAHEFPELAGLDSQIEWRRMVPVQELPQELARFDVNLAPLEMGNVFCEGKSELKYFEAALVDVPTVASPTAPYAEAMQHGTSGFLAATCDAWHAALKRLVTEPELRQRMGQTAFLDVLWRFGPERRAELAGTVLEQVLASEGTPAARSLELELRRATAKRHPTPDCADFTVVFEAGSVGNSEAAVVVPLYNYAGHVLEALESVQAQTVPFKELVVVEDCSTDDSLRVAEAWLRQHAASFTHVALLKNRQNSGLARTRNAGFAFADAPFILPLDADNRILPRYLETCLETIKRTGAAVAFATIQEFGDGNGLRSAQPWNPGRFIGGNYIDAMALLRRSAWAAVGGYQRMTVMGWEDYELWCRFVEAGLWGVWVPEVLAHYRVHGQSMLHTHTDINQNRRRLSEEMRKLHPWVDAFAGPAGAEADDKANPG